MVNKIVGTRGKAIRARPIQANEGMGQGSVQIEINSDTVCLPVHG
jgi:hypothetical protein